MTLQALGRTSLRQAYSAAESRNPQFGNLVRLAATACGAPLASIAIVDEGESWYTSSGELPFMAIPRPDPFSQYTSHAIGVFEIGDTAADDRFRHSELVVGMLAIRSYAGCALRTASGKTLGTIAVYSKIARALSPEQRSSLLLIAEDAVARIELHARLTELSVLTDARSITAAPHPEDTQAVAILESAPVAIYHTDATGNIVYSNQACRRIFGLKLGGDPNAWIQRVHPDDRTRVKEAWEDFCRHPVPARFSSFRAHADDGSIRHYSGQIVAADGFPGWIGTVSDFTNLVVARDHLRKVETMFRDTFDQAPIGIAHADRHGKILRCNHAFQAMMGFDTEELISKKIEDITHSEDIARISTELKRLWNEDIQFVDLEKRYLRKDGSSLWVHMTAALVHEGDAKPEYSVEFLRDVTVLKESAAELERVHQLLITASRQAGMAEIATNVLHNVGNILNSVNVSATLVTDNIKQSKVLGVSRVATLLQEKGTEVGAFISHDERGKRIPEYLGVLGEQLLKNQKMALEELVSLRENLELIKDTVAMQQNYAKLCGLTETVAVADLVEDSLHLNAGAFARHGVTLRREFGEVPEITIDKHKVLQILVNLMRNAKYACDESGRTDKLLTLRIERAPSGDVRICVIDNGVGISAENMLRIFNHGFTTRALGHGFGLHSAALAAKELGGSLTAKSDGSGCGANFILDLPCNPPLTAHA